MFGLDSGSALFVRVASRFWSVGARWSFGAVLLWRFRLGGGGGEGEESGNVDVAVTGVLGSIGLVCGCW